MVLVLSRSDCRSGLPVLPAEEHPESQRADAAHRGPQRDLLQPRRRPRVLQLHGERRGFSTSFYSALVSSM